MGRIRRIQHSGIWKARELGEALLRTSGSGWLNPGLALAELESVMPVDFGCRWGVGTTSGTEAIALALRVLGLSRGDRVAVPSYCCRAVADAVRRADMTPVVVDNDPSDLGIGSIDSVKSRVSALIQVHQFGRVARVWDRKWEGLGLVHDCCQLPSPLAARVAFRPKASSLSVISFEGTKPYPAGMGGLVMGADAAAADRARSAISREYRPGATNSHDALGDLIASAALVQWRRKGKLQRRRRMFYRQWERALSAGTLRDGGVKAILGARVVPYRFLVEMPESRSFMAKLEPFGFRRPVDPEPLHSFLRLDAEAFPVARSFDRSLLSCPMAVSLDGEQIERAVQALEAAISETAGGGRRRISSIGRAED